MSATAPGTAAAVRRRRARWAVVFFTWVMQRQIARNFHALRLARPAPGAHPSTLPADRPIIVYSNHPAWWDPALYIVLADRYFSERASYGPMDAAALAHYRILERVGIFGIQTAGYRGAASFLRIAEGLLADPRQMLWITAQGSFADPRTRPVALRPGLARLLARVPEAIAVPLAIEYPFWHEKQPEALCRFGRPIEAADANADRLAGRLTETMDQLAESARAVHVTDFETVIAGRVGVGGIYDLGRRMKALARGRRFDARHERDDVR